MFDLSSGAETPDYVYIQPSPVATATPAAASAPVPATVAPVPAPAPPLITAPAPVPPLNPPSPNPDRVVRELGHEADVRIPGRMQGEMRTMRNLHHSMGLMSHAWLAQKMANHEAFDEALREHELPRAVIDLRASPASDFANTVNSCRGEGIGAR